MSRLSNEKSAYLRHSAYQKIDWYPWSEEAFQKAKAEGKAVFLSSGAVWCHWCHVMAKECFENEDIIKFLNENFICIKLDRDERPDIDRRYQLAVAAMGTGGGWPLSVFLTANRKPFFGGTYFPPEDMLGRPGFKKVIKTVADFYINNKEKIEEYADKLISALRQQEILSGRLSQDILDDAANTILSAFDPQNGGFGSAPKFPMPGAIEFFINRYYFTRNQTIGSVVKSTLNSMAKGGIHDQIGGGFHRYSTDQAWIIPHFEKMADDNAWLLRNYLDAYAVFRDPNFKIVAEGIIRFVDAVLTDPQGGFYASQDADITPDDEGGYFTWTEEDIRDILSPDEFEIIKLHLWNERGAMHHNSLKRVLFVSMDMSDISKRTGKGIQEIEQIVRAGKAKMLQHRDEKESPFVDRNIYTSINGMLISAYLKAYKILKRKDLKETALKSLERIWNLRCINNELLHSDNVKAMLDDYVYLIDALLNAYEAIGNSDYLVKAKDLMDRCIENLWDKDNAGFFDSLEPVLGIRLKGIEDIPHPSPNSVAIGLLLKLYNLTDSQSYLKLAEKSLEAFSNQALNLGINGAYYFCSLEHYYKTVRLSIYGEGDLSSSALSHPRPYTVIRYISPSGLINIPQGHFLVPCIGTNCYEAIYSENDLNEFLDKH